MSDMTPEQKQAEAESWKQWETAWGNTESGAHAFGWLNGYKAGQAASEAARAALVLKPRLLTDSRRFLVDALDDIGMWADERLSGDQRRELSGMMVRLATAASSALAAAPEATP
jgi:hypothetical protein